jgi:hypothetical protein
MTQRECFDRESDVAVGDETGGGGAPRTRWGHLKSDADGLILAIEGAVRGCVVLATAGQWRK